MSESRCVLGIDPGLSRTGYAVVSRNGRAARLIDGGVIRTDRERNLSDRICDIACGLREVIEEHQPSIVAVEQAFAHARNYRSSLMIAHVRGAILLVAAEAKLPVIHISATEVKRLLTGFGRATKEQMQSAIRFEFKLSHVLEPHDVADASAVALSVLHQVKFAA